MASVNQAPATTQVDTKNTLDTVISETMAGSKKRSDLLNGAAAILGVAPNKVITLLQQVWKTSKQQAPLTVDEMFTGISLVARYELDPVAKEIYVTRGKDGALMTIVSYDGWIKILNRTDHYDGFEQEFGYDDAGNVAWIETRIHSKTRRYPAVYRAFAKEYSAISGYIATKIPIHMLGVFSLRHAARRFTPIGAYVVTEEEAAYIQQHDLNAEHGGQAAAGATQAATGGVDRLKQRVTPQPSQRPAQATPGPQGGVHPAQAMRDALAAGDRPAFERAVRAACQGRTPEERDIIEFEASEMAAEVQWVVP